jgi:dTDP-4-dehydrorhamnose reductase
MGSILQRVLIIGARGQLGSELMRSLAPWAPVGYDHTQLEIEIPESIERAFEVVKPTLVVNTAAFHNLEECEQQPGRAFAINVVAIDRLAAAVSQSGAAFATMSTDYVFDGEKQRPYCEEDETRPLNLYGLSRLCGELSARRHGSRWFIFRTCAMFGARRDGRKGNRFVDNIVSQARSGKRPRVVNDLILSPSYAVDVASAMRDTFEREAFGLYHVTNAGSCTWFDLAQEALRLAGLPADVEPISYREYGSIVPRPLYTVLDQEALRRLGVAMSPWQDGLRRSFETRVAA